MLYSPNSDIDITDSLVQHYNCIIIVRIYEDIRYTSSHFRTGPKFSEVSNIIIEKAIRSVSSCY